MNNPALFAVEAYKLIENGDLQQALSLCDEGLAKYFDYPTAYLVAIKAALEAEGVDRAKEYIDKAKQNIDLDYVAAYLEKEINSFEEKQRIREEETKVDEDTISEESEEKGDIFSEQSNDMEVPIEENHDNITIDDFAEIGISSDEIVKEMHNPKDIANKEVTAEAEDTPIEETVAEEMFIDDISVDEIISEEELTVEVMPVEAQIKETLIDEAPTEDNIPSPEELSDMNWEALTAEIKLDEEVPVPAEKAMSYPIEEAIYEPIEAVEEQAPLSDFAAMEEVEMLSDIGNVNQIEDPADIDNTNLLAEIDEIDIPKDFDIAEDFAIPEEVQMPEDIEQSEEIDYPSMPSVEDIELNIGDISLPDATLMNAGEGIIAGAAAGEMIDAISDEVSSKADKLGDYQKFASAMQDAFESTIYTQPEAVIPEIEFTAKFDGNNPENNDISDEELVIQEVETNYSDEEYNYYTDYSEKYQGMRGFALKFMGKRASGRKFQANKLNSLPGLNNTPTNIGGATNEVENSYRAIPPAPEFNIDEIPNMELNNFSFNIDARNMNLSDEEVVDYSESEDDSVAIVSDTMVNILAMQGAYVEAIDMLEKLKTIHPDKTDEYQSKIDSYQAKIDELNKKTE